jgi:hypothetical protein
MRSESPTDDRRKAVALEKAFVTGPPDLDLWLPKPALRVAHRRESPASAEALWRAARETRLSDTAMLGRLIRWRIPGLARDESFDDLFREPPFTVLKEGEHVLVSGLVGRIWTLRRDYPQLSSAQEFADWSQGGTARVVMANWVECDGGRCALASEVRVEALGTQGRLGVAAVRPMVRGFQSLIGSDAIAAAVRRAERGS